MNDSDSSNEYVFPKDFLWGTSTSAHQTEGDNVNSDWWRWEWSKSYRWELASCPNDSKKDREYPLEPSGKACDSYNRYEEDFDLCVKLNNNAIRISIEWARIEPREGVFDGVEIEHYKKVLKAAKSRGLNTFVTLHHFTNPIWFADKGGWENFKSAHFFAKYAKKCAEEFENLVDVFLTINEPQVYVYMSYMNGTWPPNKINPFLSLVVQINMMRAHRRAYDTIKNGGNPGRRVTPPTPPTIGIVKHIVWYETYSHRLHLLDRLIVKFRNFIGSDFFLLPIRNKLDVIGLNYYFTNRICHLRTQNPNDLVNDLGWWINPDGLRNVLLNLKKYNLPIYITENGLADSKDEKRKEFIRDMLISCSKAIKGGVNLKGYFHWSLIDNYEWHHGFWPRFGLVEIDHENNLERKPRKSFYYYSKICAKGEI